MMSRSNASAVSTPHSTEATPNLAESKPNLVDYAPKLVKSTFILVDVARSRSKPHPDSSNRIQIWSNRPRDPVETTPHAWSKSCQRIGTQTGQSLAAHMFWNKSERAGSERE